MADELSQSLASLKIDRSAAPKRSGPPRWIFYGAALAALGGLGYLSLDKLEAKVFKTEVTLTEVTSVSPAQASIELTATGYVQADRDSRVAPKVPGRVAKVHVTQGQVVQEGDPLIELDPADDNAAIVASQARVQAAIAQAKGAHARVLASEADLKEATQRAERERRLAGQGVTASAGADDLEARVQSLTETVKAVKAAASAADAEASALGAQVQVLRTGLRNLTLLAPIAGRVVTKPPQIGEYIGPQPAGVSIDMGGIRVADFSTLLVETDIPEGRLSQVKPGAPAEIVLDAYPSQRYRGQVKEITPQVDRAKATVKVRVAFTDALDGVLPDMAARVSFLSKPLDPEALKAPPKIVVPASALAERAGGKVVFVVEDDKVRMVPVRLGAPFGSGFELLNGPAPGSRLVQNPPATLADGQKIKQKEEG